MPSTYPTIYPNVEYLHTESLIVQPRSKLRLQKDERHRLLYAEREEFGLKTASGALEGVPSIRLRPGELVIVSPDLQAELLYEGSASAQLVVVYIQVSRSILQGAPRPIRLPQLQQWMQLFTSSGAVMETVRYYELQSCVYALLAAYLKSYESVHNPVQDLGDYVEQTKHHMGIHYADMMDVESIAKASGVSPSRFYQAFKQQTGFSPNKYMTVVRLKASLGLLSKGDMPVSTVAHTVGYHDELYFSRLFKRHMSMSPTEYVSGAQRRIANLCPVFRGDLSVLGLTADFELPRGWSEQPDPHVLAVEAALPDIIFTYPIEEELHRRLSNLAPVVMLHWRRVSWHKRLRNIGEILGIAGVARWWMELYTAKADHARSLVQKRLGQHPYLIVEVRDTYYQLYGPQRKKMCDLFYDELGIGVPQKVLELGFETTEEVEQLVDWSDGRVIFLLPNHRYQEREEQIRELWMKHQSGMEPGKDSCICLRYDPPLQYNAQVYDDLIDQLIEHLTGL